MARSKASRARLIAIAVGIIAVLLLIATVLIPVSIRRARERTLRQDLFALRSGLHYYTLDKNRRPQSLDEFVAAGYLRQVPKDPMTEQTTTWVLEWSDDPKTPGIRNIRSGSPAYRTW